MIKQLKIGCNLYKIESVKGLGVWGYCLAPQKKIQINKNISAKDRNITIFHEAMHAIINSYGLHVPEEMEETTVRILENSVVQLLQDNPRFAREFINSLAG